MESVQEVQRVGSCDLERILSTLSTSATHKGEAILMGLDKSTFIHRWCCDASRALKVTYRRCLQYHTLFEVIITDVLNDYLKLYTLSRHFINYQIYLLTIKYKLNMN